MPQGVMRPGLACLCPLEEDDEDEDEDEVEEVEAGEEQEEKRMTRRRRRKKPTLKIPMSCLFDSKMFVFVFLFGHLISECGVTRIYN